MPKRHKNKFPRIETLFRTMLRRYGLGPHLRQVIERWENKWNRLYDVIMGLRREREAHALRVQHDERFQDRSKGPPGEEWRFEAIKLPRDKKGRLPTPFVKEMWIPSHLSMEKLPEDPFLLPEFPLPLPERRLTWQEKILVLAAVSDAHSTDEDMIYPTEEPDDSSPSHPYATLVKLVSGIPLADWPVLYDVQREVEDELARGPGNSVAALWEQPGVSDADAPDGAAHEELPAPFDRIDEYVARFTAFVDGIFEDTRDEISELREMVADRDKPGSPAEWGKEARENPPKAKRPPDEALTAWRLCGLADLSQTAAAQKMSEELGRTIHQGQVSRWVKQVDNYIRARGVVPPLSQQPPLSVDPRVIEMGKRQGGLTQRQRPRRDPDAD